MSNNETVLPLGVNEDDFKEAVFETIRDTWLANPGGIPTMSRMNEILIKALKVKSPTHSEANLSAQDLVDHFHFSIGQAQYLTRVLRDPRNDLVPIRIDEKARQGIWEALHLQLKGVEQPKDVTFYLHLEEGHQLEHNLVIKMNEEPGPAPKIRDERGCVAVTVRLGDWDNDDFVPHSEYQVLCGLIGLPGLPKPTSGGVTVLSPWPSPEQDDSE